MDGVSVLKKLSSLPNSNENENTNDAPRIGPLCVVQREGSRMKG